MKPGEIKRLSLCTFFYNNIDRRDINNKLTYWQEFFFQIDS